MEVKLHPFNSANDTLSIVVEKIDYTNPYDFKVIHRHSYFEILLFEHGCGGKQIVDFKEYKIVSKSIYIVAPGQVHLVRRRPSENGILIQFTKEFLVQVISPVQIDWLNQLQSFPKTTLTDEQFKKLFLLFKKIKTVYESKSVLKFQKLLHLFGYIFFEILDILPGKTELGHVKDCAFQFMILAEKKFREIRTVKEYAETMCVPKSKLTRKVKKHFGKTPLQIIHELLLTEIKRLLVVEQLSHKEIAYTLNFDSPSSYSRFIKKVTFLSPSELKERLVQIAH